VERVEAADPQKMAFRLPEKPSLIVLPFENVGDDPEQAEFVDGVTGDVATHLALWPGLFVIDKGTASTYAGKQVSVKQVAEELGVQYVLQGSIQGSGTRLRIATHLIDALSGRYLWSESYDRELDDLFVLQDEITLNVSTALGVEIMGAPPAKAYRACRGGENLKAQELNVKAWNTFMRINTSDNNQARELSNQAIETAGERASFLAGLAWTHFVDAEFGWSDDREASLAHSRELASQAAEFEDCVHEHSLIRMRFAKMAGKFDEALSIAEEAVRRGPNLAWSHINLAEALMSMGRSEEAIPVLLQAMRLNPMFDDNLWLMWLGIAYHDAGRFEEALSTHLEFAERAPENIWARLNLASIYWDLGRYEESREAMAEFRREHPNYTLAQLRWTGRWQKQPMPERDQVRGRNLGLPELPPPSLPDEPSFAIIPFKSEFGDLSRLANGMTRSLIEQLSETPGLFVISQHSSFFHDGDAIDAKAVGNDLGVRHLLEGELRRDGGGLRFDARLVDPPTGKATWSERFQAPNVLALQRLVAAGVVGFGPDFNALKMRN
jgi:adenylate cyclase